MAPRRKKEPLSVEHAALGRAILELREEARLTQEELAERMGTTFTRIGLLERGETDPKFTTMRRLARGLDVKLTKLAGRIERALDAEEGKGAG
jgi:transcriptional regulator with XRE-family HTH domain